MSKSNNIVCTHGRGDIVIKFSLLHLELAKPKRALTFKGTRIYRYDPLDGNKFFHNFSPQNNGTDVKVIQQ